MTGQVRFDGYEDAGVRAAVGLVNALDGDASANALPAIARVLAVDPPSVAQLVGGDVPGFVALSRQLRAVFDELDRGDLDAAASELNQLLASHPAHPYLGKEDGRWRLHHHPVDAALVPMWTSICTEGLARVVGAGEADRLGTCAAGDCARVFLDVSKNASRRFCSTTCQNRVKAAAFRRRRVTA